MIKITDKNKGSTCIQNVRPEKWKEQTIWETSI